MASVKWLLLAFWEAYSFTLCCGKYFTLVFGNTDKRSSTMPIGVFHAQTNLHCAALCDMVPSCYSFTFSKTSLGDNCRLLPSTAITSTFTLSDVGSKHFARKVDCKWRFLFSWLITQKNVLVNCNEFKKVFFKFCKKKTLVPWLLFSNNLYNVCLF